MPPRPTAADLPPVAADLDTTRCPLCGQPNACGMAQTCGGSALPPSACWCQEQTFSAALLARVPPVARGRACVCRACAQSAEGGPAQDTPPPP